GQKWNGDQAGNDDDNGDDRSKDRSNDEKLAQHSAVGLGVGGRLLHIDFHARANPLLSFHDHHLIGLVLPVSSRYSDTVSVQAYTLHVPLMDHSLAHCIP
ncbi:MAG: hypothetical protein AAGC96_14705, partial [Pseudomonadota bacterium]